MVISLKSLTSGSLELIVLSTGREALHPLISHDLSLYQLQQQPTH
jgi:hypothetical protein